jgi:hypothetical protein
MENSPILRRNALTLLYSLSVQSSTFCGIKELIFRAILDFTQPYIYNNQIPCLPIRNHPKLGKPYM